MEAWLPGLSGRGHEKRLLLYWAFGAPRVSSPPFDAAAAIHDGAPSLAQTSLALQSFARST